MLAVFDTESGEMVEGYGVVPLKELERLWSEDEGKNEGRYSQLNQTAWRRYVRSQKQLDEAFSK